MIDESHQKTEAEEASGGENHQQHAIGAADEADAKEATRAEEFAHHTQKRQRPGEAETHEEAVESGMSDTILRGKGFGTAEDNAVHHDEGDEEAEGLIHIGHKGLHNHLDDGDEGGDNDDEGRNTHLVGDDALKERDDDIRHQEHKGRGKTHHHAVDGRGGGGQRGAHAEDEHPCGVFFDKTVLDYIFCFHRAMLFIED